MGAWGAGYFDSDMSCDCWAELRHENTENALELIITYLQNVTLLFEMKMLYCFVFI